MIRVAVSGYGAGLVSGYGDAYTWSEDDGDIGDWQSLLSQGIATAGTIYNNRLAAKSGRQLLGLQGSSSLAPLQPVPGATVFQEPAPAPSIPWVPIAIGGAILIGGFLFLRR